MWPRVAVFEAAIQLWRLKNAPESEKVCIPRIQRLRCPLRVSLEGKNLHTAQRKALPPGSFQLSSEMQEVPRRKMFHAPLERECARF